MILIADSGSSKTDWALIDEKGVGQMLKSVGLNPDFHSESSILEEIKAFSSRLMASPKVIYFYGSGASSEARQAPLKNAFDLCFPDASSFIDHDLLGAARASLGDQAGLACILGTGSNCAAYDGKYIIKEYRSGGYILSDEGGGVYMGKLLLKAFIEDQLEPDLKKLFQSEFKLSIDQILQKIYKESMPNRFIASFSEFIAKHQSHPQLQDIIRANFDAFFNQKVLRFEEFKDLPIGLVGSVANHFKGQLQYAVDKFDCKLKKVVAKPIDELAKYHMARLAEERS